MPIAARSWASASCKAPDVVASPDAWHWRSHHSISALCFSSCPSRPWLTARSLVPGGGTFAGVTPATVADDDAEAAEAETLLTGD